MSRIVRRVTRNQNLFYDIKMLLRLFVRMTSFAQLAKLHEL